MTKRAALIWLEADLRKRLARAKKGGDTEEAVLIEQRIEHVEGLLKNLERRLLGR